MCELFNVDKVKAHILLTELKSNQKNTSKMFSEQETRIWLLTKRSNRLCKFGYSDMTLIVGLTIKFIDTDRTLKNLLLVCRDFNDVLKTAVLKQSLLRADQHRINEKRRYLWL
jgi:hypothetical protein